MTFSEVRLLKVKVSYFELNLEKLRKITNYGKS